jgi:hypothetical protein
MSPGDTGRPDGCLDFFNQTWLRYVGRPLDDLQGWKWTVFIHPEAIALSRRDKREVRLMGMVLPPWRRHRACDLLILLFVFLVRVFLLLLAAKTSRHGLGGGHRDEYLDYFVLSVSIDYQALVFSLG